MQDLRHIATRRAGLVERSRVAELEELMLGSAQFPWYVQSNTSAGLGREDDWWLDLWPDSPQLTHNFVVGGAPTSALTDQVLGIIGWDDVAAKLGIDRGILRMKANLLLNTAGPPHNRPHVDQPDPHVVLIYYVNDSDGDTVVFDREYGEVVDGSASIVQRESPAAGDILIMDGRHVHASCSPVVSRMRAVINFNVPK